MYKDYDIVKSSRRLSESVPRGTRGTVLLVYQEPRTAYEVEFVNENGVTLDVITVDEKDLENGNGLTPSD
jgi:hypothetical protein